METGLLYQIEVVWINKPRENYIFSEGTDFIDVRNEFDLLIATGNLGDVAKALLLWGLTPTQGTGWELIEDHEFVS